MSFITNLLSLPVLSVRQPWASYLVSGLKSVELRTWNPNYRGWLWIHTGKRPDTVAMNLLKLNSEEFLYGGLIGLAKLEDYFSIDSEKKWYALRDEHLAPGYYNGPCYGWQFSDVISLPDVIECPGELGLFQLKGTVYEKVRAEVERGAHEEFVDCARDLVSPITAPPPLGGRYGD